LNDIKENDPKLRNKFGDFSYPCFKLAKKINAKPEVAAKELEKAFEYVMECLNRDKF